MTWAVQKFLYWRLTWRLLEPCFWSFCYEGWARDDVSYAEVPVLKAVQEQKTWAMLKFLFYLGWLGDDVSHWVEVPVLNTDLEMTWLEICWRFCFEGWRRDKVSYDDVPVLKADLEMTWAMLNFLFWRLTWRWRELCWSSYFRLAWSCCKNIKADLEIRQHC